MAPELAMVGQSHHGAQDEKVLVRNLMIALETKRRLGMVLFLFVVVYTLLSVTFECYGSVIDWEVVEICGQHLDTPDWI